jgi:DNA-directed RNA polymerase subunit RPC12/RpoP
MKIKKCQKCGSENIFHITLNPNQNDEETSEIECQDCGFKIRKRTEYEIERNNFEKMMDDRDLL